MRGNTRENMCGYVRTHDAQICVCRYKVNRWQPAQCTVSNKAAVLGTSMAVWVGTRGVVLLIQMILSLFSAFSPSLSFFLSLSIYLSSSPFGLWRSLLSSSSFSTFNPLSPSGLPSLLLVPALFHGAFNPPWHSHLLYSS